MDLSRCKQPFLMLEIADYLLNWVTEQRTKIYVRVPMSFTDDIRYTACLLWHDQRGGLLPNYHRPLRYIAYIGSTTLDFSVASWFIISRIYIIILKMGNKIHDCIIILYIIKE